MKVLAKKQKTEAKLEEAGETLRALTLEKHSDGLRLWDPHSGRIRISHDYSVTNKQIKIELRNPEAILPQESSQTLKITLPKHHSITTASIEDLVEQEDPVADQPVQGEPVETTVPLSSQTKIVNKHYNYVLFYEKPPKNRSSSVSDNNLVEGKRTCQAPDCFYLTDIVPYSKALSTPTEKDRWKTAMDTELDSLMIHNIWILVPYPKHKERVIGGMWCLTHKQNEFGEVYWYEARWVVFGNHQENLLHDFNTWASVGRNEMFKTSLLLVVTFHLIPYQFDIDTAFLHGNMDAVVYIKQVTGYKQKGRENWVWRLNKSLYGTKQAPQMWKSKLTEVLLSLDMRSAELDESLFSSSNNALMLHIHVDDGFLIIKNEGLILNFLLNLNKQLKLKFKKCPTQHLGYSFVWEGDRLLINKSDLINRILDQFNMENSKAVKTPCNSNLLNEIYFKGGTKTSLNFSRL
ncbi:hypothetical protein O181_036343 [Austropuccinia psidii MF-1]|uniref:Reverse transcriptase Ty1/copia-type domain-containing protein n=1 Tax=Austropuccinia psidii MF-1 TaxID=1389203 RepID=A0A9Q3H946_9BASI|nr:hypothetical protein [Austropuccinia psidii MF-1]